MLCWIASRFLSFGRVPLSPSSAQGMVVMIWLLFFLGFSHIFSAHLVDAFVICLWIVWYCRNTIIFYSTHASMLCNFFDRCSFAWASDYVENYAAAVVAAPASSINSSVSAVSSWFPPAAALWKLNTNVSICSEANTTGFGAVIRDNNGNFVADLLSF